MVVVANVLWSLVKRFGEDNKDNKGSYMVVWKDRDRECDCKMW